MSHFLNLAFWLPDYVVIWTCLSRGLILLNDILISELGNLVHYLGNSSDFMYATQCIYLGNYTNLKKKFKQRLFTQVFSLGDVLLLILTALATLSLICVPFLLLVLQKCVHKLVDVLFFSACKFLQQINTIRCSTSVRLLTFFLYIQSLIRVFNFWSIVK